MLPAQPGYLVKTEIRVHAEGNECLVEGCGGVFKCGFELKGAGRLLSGGMYGLVGDAWVSRAHCAQPGGGETALCLHAMNLAWRCGRATARDLLKFLFHRFGPEPCGALGAFNARIGAPFNEEGPGDMR